MDPYPEARRAVQLFYEDKPAADRAARPELTAAQKSSFCSSGKLAHDVYTTGKLQDVFSGRSGCRGELVRHPAEAGNPYGVSTFVDDYAGWGTKLGGASLAETASKKTTRYFDA